MPLYLSSSNDNEMKKIALFLTLAVMLVACSKQSADLASPPDTTLTFFSRVQYFKDNRTPATDTVWTLQLFNQQMVDSFTRYDGQIYWESSTVKEVGRLWSR